jgi:hypothetical protein
MCKFLLQWSSIVKGFILVERWSENIFISYMKHFDLINQFCRIELISDISNTKKYTNKRKKENVTMPTYNYLLHSTLDTQIDLKNE